MKNLKNATNPKPEQIKEARENANMTQSEAAKMLHSHINTWHQWESGKRTMHPAFWELFLIKSQRTTS